MRSLPFSGLHAYAKLLNSREVITPAIKYITFVIPAKAGIQRYYWMPDRACHQLDWGPA